MPKLYPHQEKAVKELSNGKILWGDVGTGKSLTAAAYIVRNYPGRDIYVITTAKKRDSLDWNKEFSSFGISRKRTDTDHPGFDDEGGTLTIDSWNNIHKYTDIKNALFIFDEQRLVGTGKWVKSFYKIARANHWIVLTATPGDVWLDYAPVFIANGFYKNITEFKREHVVYNMHAKFPKVDRYISVGRLVRYRNDLLVHMPYERHTIRHTHIEKCTYDVELFEKVVNKRWHVYEERPLRDVAEMFSVMRKVVNSDPSRIETLKMLIKKHPRVIVFYNFDYELEILRTLISNGGLETEVSQLTMQDELKDCPLRLSNDKEILAEWMRRQRKQTPVSSSDVMRERSKNSGGSQRTSNQATRFLPSSKTVGGSVSKEQEKELCGNMTASLTDSQSSKHCKTGVQNVQIAGWSGHKQDSSRLTTGNWSQKHTEEDGFGFTPAVTDQAGTSLQTATNVQIAEWNGHKHQEIPKTDRWVYLVQYVAGAEGWNCIETDCVVFWSLTYSYKNWHQGHGRIDRLNTPFKDLHYYVLKSDSPIDQAVWRSLKAKKTFNEADFGKNMRF